MKLIILILCLLIAGCSVPIQEKKDRKNITIYNNQGKTKEHVIIQDDYINIYDKDWNTKGYGRVEN